MTSGTIVKVTDKGFGFIQPDGPKANDMYFHARGMINREDFESLKVGDRVTYEVEDGKNPGDRPRAVSVSKA